MRASLFVVAFLISIPSAFAQVAKEASNGLSSFKCSFLAGHFDNEAAEKHFNKGIGYLRIFLKAWDEKKITEKEWQTEVPVLMGLMKGGPSYDFMIGRIYDSRSALSQSFRTKSIKDNL